MEITFSPDMSTPVCERTTFDVGSTGMSLYKPGETSFTSTISEDISTTLSTQRENLNALPQEMLAPSGILYQRHSKKFQTEQNVFTCAKRAKLLLRA